MIQLGCFFHTFKNVWGVILDLLSNAGCLPKPKCWPWEQLKSLWKRVGVEDVKAANGKRGKHLWDSPCASAVPLAFQFCTSAEPWWHWFLLDSWGQGDVFSTQGCRARWSHLQPCCSLPRICSKVKNLWSHMCDKGVGNPPLRGRGLLQTTVFYLESWVRLSWVWVPIGFVSIYSLQMDCKSITG